MAWSVHACAQLEQAGVPAVSVLTEQFLPMGRAAAANRGLDPLAFVVLPTGFDALPDEEVRDAVAANLSGIVEALIRG